MYKRFLIFLCDGAVGLDDLSRRDLWSCRLVWLTGSGGPGFAILRGDSPEYGRKLKPTSAYQPVEKGVIDRVSRHGEAYRGEGGFAILRDDEDDLNDQDGSSGRNKHEQGANSARHGLLRGAGADELAHQQR